MDKQEMIKLLNEDLAGELGAISSTSRCREGYRPVSSAVVTVLPQRGSR
jgi:hypothetical protein